MPMADELKVISDSFETKHPQDVLAYAMGRYAPHSELACSRGAKHVQIQDMIPQKNPSTPLFDLDTDLQIKENYDVHDRIVTKYGLLPDQVIQSKSILTP